MLHVLYVLYALLKEVCMGSLWENREENTYILPKECIGSSVFQLWKKCAIENPLKFQNHNKPKQN